MSSVIIRDKGRTFVRTLHGFPTRDEAQRAAKDLWRMGHAVRVKTINGRWYVWRSWSI